MHLLFRTRTQYFTLNCVWGGETSDNIHILLYFKNWNLTTSLILREKVTSSKMFLLETKFKNRLENVIKIKYYVIFS
jgi:hypothetical protein